MIIKHASQGLVQQSIDLTKERIAELERYSDRVSQSEAEEERRRLRVLKRVLHLAENEPQGIFNG